MQAGGYEKYDVADEKAWIGEEIEGAVTQEFPSNEVVCLSNEPTCWQFGYSEDGNSFTFMPDYMFEGILSRFLDKLEEEGVISISKVKNKGPPATNKALKEFTIRIKFDTAWPMQIFLCQIPLVIRLVVMISSIRNSKNQSNKRELLFSLTKKDFDVQTFRSGGKGGQHQNTTDSGVRIIHKASDARGESRSERSQHQRNNNLWKRIICG